MLRSGYSVEYVLYFCESVCKSISNRHEIVKKTWFVN